MKIEAGYRLVSADEKFLGTDRFQNKAGLDGPASQYISNYISGQWSAKGDSDYGTYWHVLRKIDSPWISVKERQPDSSDWYFVNFTFTKGGFAWWDMPDKSWSDVSGLRGTPRIDEIKEWMEIPTRPEPVIPPITIQEGIRTHELIFNKDGSIKAGCVTIDKEKMKEIIGRWKKEQE